MKRKSWVMAVVLVPCMLIGCAGQPTSIKPASAFPELTIAEDGSELSYVISTHQYRGNEIGEIQDVTGYRVFFRLKRLEGGSTFYHLYRIEKAEAAPAPSALAWKGYDSIKEYKAIIDDSEDVDAGSKYVDQIPHDGIDTYNIYVSLMDIVMYQKYAHLALSRVAGSDDVYELPARRSKVADWLPVVRDIRFEETPTFITFLGTRHTGEKVYYYKNDNTKIYQTMSFGALTIPSKGTTRFMGFVTLDEAGEIVRATLSEYFSMEMWPMFFLKMNMLVRREQILERLQ